MKLQWKRGLCHKGDYKTLSSTGYQLCNSNGEKANIHSTKIYYEPETGTMHTIEIKERYKVYLVMGLS